MGELLEQEKADMSRYMLYKAILFAMSLAAIAACAPTRSYNAMEASNELLKQCKAGNTQACAIVMSGGSGLNSHSTVVVPQQ